MLWPEGILSILLLLLMINQGLVVLIWYRKFETFEKFKKFWVETEKQLNKNIKSLQSVQGGEYLFVDFNKCKGIKYTTTSFGLTREGAVVRLSL